MGEVVREYFLKKSRKNVTFFVEKSKIKLKRMVTQLSIVKKRFRFLFLQKKRNYFYKNTK